MTAAPSPPPAARPARARPAAARRALPARPSAALTRLDGDLHESTVDALDALDPRRSDGGFVVLDDDSLRGARQTTHDARAAHGITAPIHDIDGIDAGWRKDPPVG